MTAPTSFPFEATETTLANGLRVIVVAQPASRTLCRFRFPVSNGVAQRSRTWQIRFAHFFQHVMFRGTDASPRGNYQEIA